jgi:hypothetical protein
MTSPGPDLEAQTDGVTETQRTHPAIIPNPPSTTNTVTLQLPTTGGADAGPQPPATNTSQHRNGNAPAQQTDSSQVQWGM